MAAIGERLKNVREKRALTIEQVQKQTHIHSTVLVALEEGRCDEILTSTYVKSFLSKYAGHLGLDSRELLNEYAAVHREEETFDGISEKHKIEMEGLATISRLIHGISFALLLIAVLSLAVFFTRKAAPTFGKSLKSAKAAKPILPAPVRKVKKPDAQKAAAGRSTAVPKKTSFKLDVKIKERVLIGIKRDGVLLYKRSLPKGTTETVSAKEKIELYVAKAEAIELILDGRSLGSPGKGLIKNLEITARGVKIR